MSTTTGTTMVLALDRRTEAHCCAWRSVPAAAALGMEGTALSGTLMAKTTVQRTAATAAAVLCRDRLSNGPIKVNGPGTSVWADRDSGSSP